MTRKDVGAKNGSSSGYTPPMTYKEFGHRLDSLLLDRGWSQSDLARHAELSKDTISKWVAGKVQPNPYNLGKVANALRMSVDELYPNYLASLDHEDRRGGIEFNTSDMKTGILSLEMRVSVETARKIKELLEKDVLN